MRGGEESEVGAIYGNEKMHYETCYYYQLSQHLNNLFRHHQ